MASYRAFPRRGWALVTRVIYLVAAATTTGSLAGFLLIVFANIVGAEVLSDLWQEAHGDAVMRVGISVTSITAVVSIGLVVVFLGLSRLEYARQLAVVAERDGQMLLPVPRELTMLRSTNPFLSQYFFTLFFVIIDAFMLLILGLALGETFRYNPVSAREGLNVLLGLAAIGVLTVLLLVLAHLVWLRQWKQYSSSAMNVWGPLEKTAESRLRAQLPSNAMSARRTPARASVIKGSTIALAVAGVVFMLGVYLRQPGRRAATRVYDESGEAFIDLLIATSSAVSFAAFIALLLTLLAVFVSSVRRLSRLRAIAEGRTTAVEREGYRSMKRGKSLAAFHDLLAQSWPGETVGRILVGIGWGTAPFFAVTQQAVPMAWPEWTVPTLVITGAVGVVILSWSDGAAARSRNRLLQAWS